MAKGLAGPGQVWVDADVPTDGSLIGEQLTIANDNDRDACYTIRSVEKDGGLTLIGCGPISFVRGFAGPSIEARSQPMPADYNHGYLYDFNEGAAFQIPSSRRFLKRASEDGAGVPRAEEDDEARVPFTTAAANAPRSGRGDARELSDGRPHSGGDGANDSTVGRVRHLRRERTRAHGLHLVARRSVDRCQSSRRRPSQEPGDRRFAKEGVVSTPRRTVTPREDWQNTKARRGALSPWQGKPAGCDFLCVTDHSQEAAFHPPAPTTRPGWRASEQASRRHRQPVRGPRGLTSTPRTTDRTAPGTSMCSTAPSTECLGRRASTSRIFTSGSRPSSRTATARWSPASIIPAPRQYNDWAYRDPQITDIITMLEVINSNKHPLRSFRERPG